MGARIASLVITILSIVIALSSSFRPSEASSCIAVYWGQNTSAAEGTLKEACDTNNYKYVNIAYLTGFGGGRQPVLKLNGHCNSSAGGCRSLSGDIQYCQHEKSIKVLLSIGGPDGNYFLNSQEDARKVANYLWRNYLSGDPDGPLGDVNLDGVDFNIEYSRSTNYWEDLAKELLMYKDMDLAAAPKCTYPDVYLTQAITDGYFKYIWVQFYDNELCDYTAGLRTLERTWSDWSSIVPPVSQIFLGLPADRNAANGYIPVSNMDDILQYVRRSVNYGGLMLWNRYWDKRNSYSIHVLEEACGESGDLIAEN